MKIAAAIDLLQSHAPSIETKGGAPVVTFRSDEALPEIREIAEALKTVGAIPKNTHFTELAKKDSRGDTVIRLTGDDAKRMANSILEWRARETENAYMPLFANVGPADPKTPTSSTFDAKAKVVPLGNEGMAIVMGAKPAAPAKAL